MTNHTTAPGCYCTDCVEGPKLPLLPCPMCGGQAYALRNVGPVGNPHRICCNFCFLTTGQCITEAEAIIAWNKRTPSARITGDKDRENPVEGAPYGEGLIGRIDQLEAVNRRLAITAHSLRSVLRTIADMEYVDHQSGNQNFEVLQSVARGGLESSR